MSLGIPYQYICVEGNIGAGKTTLCELLAKDYNCKLILEEFAENPFLPYFYDNPDRYAFPVELFFLTERHKQLEEHLMHRDLFYEFIVSDYFFLKTLLFAKNNLGPEEFRLFQRMYQALAANFPTPDLLLFLHRSPLALKKLITQRGRQYESNITVEYLQNLQDIYFEYFKNELSFPIVVVDADRMDFLNNPADYQEVRQLLQRKFMPGIHRISLIN